MKHILNLAASKSVEKPKGKSKQSKAKAKPKLRWKIGVAVAVLLALLAGGTGLAIAHYSDKILPGVAVAGINVGGKTRAEAAALLQEQIAKLDVTIQNNGTTWKPSPEQLGIDYDVSDSVNQAFEVGRTGSLQQRLGAFSARLPLEFHYNSAATNTFIDGVVHATSKDPVDASLVVKNGVIQILPDQDGETTGVQNAADKIRSALPHPGPLALAVSAYTLHPQITAADLEQPLEQAKSLAATPVSITAGGQNLSPTAAQEASWLSFTPDPTNHTVKVAFDSGKVQSFVGGIVKKLTVSPIPQEIGVNLDENNAQSVIQQGKNGQTVGNAADLSSGLLAALTAGKPFTGTATTSVVPFGTKQMNIYDRWIEVNLTTQRMIAWQKGTAVLNVLISSGISIFPTPTGTFHIYGKSRVTEMKGDLGTPYAYDLPNVQWVSWWMESYSIHGTYWHHNFGHPMSHGCINATNADAQFIYNWAPVGTAVVIHR